MMAEGRFLYNLMAIREMVNSLRIAYSYVF